MKLNRKNLVAGLIGAAAIIATSSASAFWGNWGGGPWNWGGGNWGNNWGGSPWGWGGGYPYYGGGYPYGGGWGNNWGGSPWGWGGGYPYYGGGYGYTPYTGGYTYPSTTTTTKPAAKADKK